MLTLQESVACKGQLGQKFMKLHAVLHRTAQLEHISRTCADRTALAT